ncbi:hypothetical protein LCI18_010882 [Fusarium solani-melongenae]|uniref:Uncharacterized protein n=1 Tax=Fusarium solani subsp. cucurbitae TaxID=2747967 RepID=A0ACD3ZFF1_FUSSC|nr:hypothetical protein LCI18_010882 [Fusarium solani-melongenae]
MYSLRRIEAKRFRLFVRTEEGDKPTQVELEFLPSCSLDDGPLRIKVGRNSDGKRSIGWMNRLGRDVMLLLYRETVTGVVNVFPGGRGTVRDNRTFFNIPAALFSISHFVDARGVRDPLHNQNHWEWGIEVKSPLAQPGMKENNGSFDPAYDEMFHKYTVSYDRPLVGDLMSAAS